MGGAIGRGRTLATMRNHADVGMTMPTTGVVTAGRATTAGRTARAIGAVARQETAPGIRSDLVLEAGRGIGSSATGTTLEASAIAAGTTPAVAGPGSDLATGAARAGRGIGSSATGMNAAASATGVRTGAAVTSPEAGLVTGAARAGRGIGSTATGTSVPALTSGVRTPPAVTSPDGGLVTATGPEPRVDLATGGGMTGTKLAVSVSGTAMLAVAVSLEIGLLTGSGLVLGAGRVTGGTATGTRVAASPDAAGRLVVAHPRVGLATATSLAARGARVTTSDMSRMHAHVVLRTGVLRASRAVSSAAAGVRVEVGRLLTAGGTRLRTGPHLAVWRGTRARVVSGELIEIGTRRTVGVDLERAVPMTGNHSPAPSATLGRLATRRGVPVRIGMWARISTSTTVGASMSARSQAAARSSRTWLSLSSVGPKQTGSSRVTCPAGRRGTTRNPVRRLNRSSCRQNGLRAKGD